MTKRRLIHWRRVTLALGLAVLVAGGVFVWLNRPRVYLASELGRTYAHNSSVSDRRLAGQTLTVEGEVIERGTGFTGQPYVVLAEEGMPSFLIHCDLVEPPDVLRRVRFGQWLVVRGRWTGGNTSGGHVVEGRLAGTGR